MTQVTNIGMINRVDRGAENKRQDGFVLLCVKEAI